MTLLDASSGMLEKAKEKLSDHIASGKVKDVVQATMPPLPFPDESFDAVMFNLVNPISTIFLTVLKGLDSKSMIYVSKSLHFTVIVTKSKIKDVNVVFILLHLLNL